MSPKREELEKLYEKNRRELLRHSTKITERVPLLDINEKRDSAITEIKREINTIKLYMEELYRHCSDRVRKAIDDLSEKGTIICGLADPELFIRNRSAILRWASLVNDLRLDVRRSRLDFISGLTINVSLIHIDTGPSMLEVGN